MILKPMLYQQLSFAPLCDLYPQLIVKQLEH